MKTHRTGQKDYLDIRAGKSKPNNETDVGVQFHMRIIKLNLIEGLMFWWQSRFGKYKKHCFKVTDKNGKDITEDFYRRLSTNGDARIP